jgi:hypothetical protein
MIEVAALAAGDVDEHAVEGALPRRQRVHAFVKEMP